MKNLYNNTLEELKNKLYISIPDCFESNRFVYNLVDYQKLEMDNTLIPITNNNMILINNFYDNISKEIDETKEIFDKFIKELENLKLKFECL